MEDKSFVLRNFLRGVGATIIMIFYILPFIVPFIFYILLEYEDYAHYTYGIICFLFSGFFLDDSIANTSIISFILFIAYSIVWVNLLILP